MSKPVRLTEDFVTTFRAVKKQLGGTYDAGTFTEKLRTDPDFVALVERFDFLVRSILDALKKKQNKTIKQAHDDFAEQYAEFQNRWRQLSPDYLIWRMGPLPEFIFDEVGPNERSMRGDEWDDNFEFDDEQENGASLVGDMVEYVRNRAEIGGGKLNRMAEAFEWFEARGLNLAVFERRWKKIPFISVPKHVSDRHAIKGQEGLYWLLDEALRAYWFGADAAAISMCRALTEELIEKHYLDQNKIIEITSRSGTPGTPLNRFIKEAEDKYPQVKKHHLKEKVQVANEVLHKGKLDISSMKRWNSAENLIRVWVSSLKSLIEKAPRAK
jgi:hypothetical protein